MRILITGDRFWACHDLARSVLQRVIDRHGPEITIIHGGGTGVDESFGRAARALGLVVEPHLADWYSLGNMAGPARNAAMVKAGADLCIAVHSSLATSKGTKHCARQAIAAGIPTYLVVADDGVPRRLCSDDPRLE